MKCKYCQSENILHEETFIKRGTVPIKHAVTIQCEDCQAIYDYNVDKQAIISEYYTGIDKKDMNPIDDITFYHLIRS